MFERAGGEIRLITLIISVQIMATKLEKPENATLPLENAPSDKDLQTELKLARADLRELKQKHTALESNFKRAQTKIAKLTSERPDPKDEAPPSPPAKNEALESSAKAADSLTSTNVTPNHVDHEMAWVPPYCGEHGCKNDLFKDEVVCANCKGPIGSEKYAKHQLQACPLCGVNAGYKPQSGYKLQHNSCTGPECRIK